MAARISAAPGSIGEFLKYRWPSCRPSAVLPWPPDTFAMAAALLRCTGTYLRVLAVSEQAKKTAAKRWRLRCIRAGEKWRENIDATSPDSWDQPLPQKVVPKFVRERWRRLLNASSRPIVSIETDEDLVTDLLTICIAADVASAGMGLPKKDGGTDAFMVRAGLISQLRHERRNFCSDVDTTKLRVMPKLHTPQRGLTIRSLSHHLALIEPSEIELFWWPAYGTHDRFDILNVLLLPWPRKISSQQFNVVTRSAHHAGESPTRLFSYTPPRWDDADLREALRRAIGRAKADAHRIHAIILPELALNAEQYAIAEEVAINERALLIAGVQMDDEGTSRNAAVAQPIGFSDFEFSEDDTIVDRTAADLLRIIQFKHHRWCLDRNQIIQYGLGGRLPASKDCWEDIGLEGRQLNFFTFAGWMTMSVLICEDLARQDPVSDALRAVAPGLVVALLMDGPQLQNRWSSRYATVLAEDPGCSVLTITSLGMSLRSKPAKLAAGEDKSNVIALWRDPIHGAEEISLAPDAIGCVLSLVCHTREECTADGRGDGGVAFYPVFAGVHQVFA